MKQNCPLLIFISINLLLASPIQAKDMRKPVIDMHMHGYLGELAIPNPNTGKILVHNGDEHRKASLRLLRKAMKRYGRPQVIVTDDLRFYQAAMCEIGIEARQESGCWLNNRAENSHQLFWRQERAKTKFRSAKSLQKFAAVHASFHNHFNQQRHLYSRKNFKVNRSAAHAEWRQLAA